MDNNTEKRQDTIASLFTDGELKELFRKFLVLIGGIEVFIFFACWIYQLGINEFDRFGPVNIPFPWKIYFTVAFLAPVAVIFLLGLFVVAFNRYIYGTKPAANDDGEAPAQGTRKITAFMNDMLQLPFLFSLLLLGAGVLVIYRIDDIAGFVARLGVESFEFFRILSFVGIGVLTIFGLVWMVMKYRLRQKEMDYQYKETVMKQLGVLVEDTSKVVKLQELLPQGLTPEEPEVLEMTADLSAEEGETLDVSVDEEQPLGNSLDEGQSVDPSPEDSGTGPQDARDVSAEAPQAPDVPDEISREEEPLRAKG